MLLVDKERIFTKLLGRKFGKMKTVCIEHGIGSGLARKERQDLKLMIKKYNKILGYERFH